MELSVASGGACLALQAERRGPKPGASAMLEGSGWTGAAGPWPVPSAPGSAGTLRRDTAGTGGV